MKYFFSKTSPKYTTTPELLGWRELIDKRNINRERSHLLPKREVIKIKSHPETIYTDIFLYPFPLVTPVIFEMIQLYEPGTISKKIILLDQENRKSQLYHLPILDEVTCLHSSSNLSPDKSTIRHGFLDLSAIGQRTV